LYSALPGVETSYVLNQFVKLMYPNVELTQVTMVPFRYGGVLLYIDGTVTVTGEQYQPMTLPLEISGHAKGQGLLRFMNVVIQIDYLSKSRQIHNCELKILVPVSQLPPILSEAK